MDSFDNPINSQNDNQGLIFEEILKTRAKKMTNRILKDFRNAIHKDLKIEPQNKKEWLFYC